MTANQFLDLFNQITSSAVTADDLPTPLDQIDGWDSLGVVSLISELDHEHGLRIDASRLAECRTLADLAVLADVSIAG